MRATQRGGVRGTGGSRTDLVVALGREGKQPLAIDPNRSPLTAAMAAKLQSRRKGSAAYRRRKWLAEPPNGWIKNVLGFRQFSMRGLHRVQSRVETRVHGAEPATNGDDAGGLTAGIATNTDSAVALRGHHQPLAAPESHAADTNGVRSVALASIPWRRNVCRPDS